MLNDLLMQKRSRWHRLGWAGGLLCCLGFVAVAIWQAPLAQAGDADTADVPPGTVAFFGSADSRCPMGWRILADSPGRLLVGVTAPDAIGKSVGKPLSDQEDRTHQHAFSAAVELPYKSISAADGPNGQGAGAKKYSTQGDSDPATSGLPFVQLTLCEKQ